MFTKTSRPNPWQINSSPGVDHQPARCLANKWNLRPQGVYPIPEAYHQSEATRNVACGTATFCQFSRVQLRRFQTQASHCVRCHTVNRDILVGLLLPYIMEAKERCSHLLDMHPVPSALNVGDLSNVAGVLPQTVLPRCHWSKLLSIRDRPLRCSGWVVMAFHEVC